MRILFCNYEYPPIGGGGGVITALLAQEMAKSHEVTVLTSDGFGLPFDSVEESVRVIRAPVMFRKRRSVATMRSMLTYVISGIVHGKALIREKQFDVVSTHFVLPTGPVGDFVSREARVPNALSLIGGDLYDPSKKLSPHRHLVFRLLVRWLLGRAEMIIGDSRDTLSNMRKFYAGHISGIRIPLGIRIPKLRQSSKEALGFQSEDLLLITVSRLVRRKAIEQLVAMMRSFQGRPVHLLIVGSGPAYPELKLQVERSGLDDQVHFAGFVDGQPKFDLLRAADIYVSSSQHEGFGLSYLEAMASKLPIICYDHGGQTDFLSDGETGFLVPLNNVAEFIGRIEHLNANPAMRKSMGDIARKRVQRYAIEEVASRYEKAFRAIAERRVISERALVRESPAAQ